MSPSPSRSLPARPFHQPEYSWSPELCVVSSNLPSLFINIRTGPHSMLNNRSTHPSPFASDQSALVTIPQFSIPEQICLVTSLNSTFSPLTVSLSNSVLFGPVGYFPGRNRPPTKTSKSPSRSKSAADATDPLTIRSGNVPSGACSYAPLPSFKYSLSLSSSALDSTPPLTTKRSASPSRSASNSKGLMSSELL